MHGRGYNRAHLAGDTGGARGEMMIVYFAYGYFAYDNGLASYYDVFGDLAVAKDDCARFSAETVGSQPIEWSLQDDGDWGGLTNGYHGDNYVFRIETREFA